MTVRPPVRLQLSRAKGFNLLALSLATNGLDAVNVARPSRFGNPFRIGESGTRYRMCAGGGERWFVATSAEQAVRLFRRFTARQVAFQLIVHGLAGKNLACWCCADQPCHADVLLEIANAQ